MKREFLRTTVTDDEGNIIPAFVPQEMAKFRDWNSSEWTPALQKHKEERVKWLEQTIDKVQGILDMEDLTEYERLMFLFFQDQLRVDFKEDKQRLKYKGKIPKHIDERCMRNASKSFSKYRQWGDKFFEQLKEDIDVHLWGNVIIEEDPVSGGGKI